MGGTFSPDNSNFVHLRCYERDMTFSGLNEDLTFANRDIFKSPDDRLSALSILSNSYGSWSESTDTSNPVRNCRNFPRNGRVFWDSVQLRQCNNNRNESQVRFDEENAPSTKVNHKTLESSPRATLDNDIFCIKERTTGQKSRIDEVDLLASYPPERVNRMR